jgi:hypothetical protein
LLSLEMWLLLLVLVLLQLKKISNLINKIKRKLQLRWNQHNIDDLKELR